MYPQEKDQWDIFLIRICQIVKLVSIVCPYIWEIAFLYSSSLQWAQNWLEEKVSFLTSTSSDIKVLLKIFVLFSHLNHFRLSQDTVHRMVLLLLIPGVYQLPAEDILKSIFPLIVTLQLVPYPSGGSSHWCQLWSDNTYTQSQEVPTFCEICLLRMLFSISVTCPNIQH